MRSHDLNGGEANSWLDDPTHVHPGFHPPGYDPTGCVACGAPARAVSCLLEQICDEAIELLSFIDQPNYSTVLYTVETRENL